MALGTSVSRGVGADGIPIPQPPKKTATRLPNRVAATWPGGHRRAVSREGTRRALSGAQRPRLLLPPRKSDPITRPHVGSQHEGGNDAPLPSICPRRPRQEPFTDEKGAPRGPLSHSDQWLRSLDSNQGPSGYEPDELPLLHSAIEIIDTSCWPARIRPGRNPATCSGRRAWPRDCA